ncbi:MAG: hypothetical protein M0R75_15525 [Dehalococcoidia bacterium]|nr:hypothetical protein [Dehalococcoidia bacterium]
MAVDVAEVEEKVEAGRVQRYYGFDPESEYVIRSRNREYTGVTQKHYEFLNGQARAGRMLGSATEEQRWARAERLAWFRSNPGYAIYERGSEPDRAQEPMWAALPAEEVAESTGEADTGETRWVAATPRRTPEADLRNRKTQPMTVVPVANDEVNPEAQPDPEITRTSPRLTAVPDPTPDEGEPSAGPSFPYPQA